MGNGVSAKDFEERELGEAHLDSSSPNVIDSKSVSHDKLKLVRRGKTWYFVSKYNKKQEFAYAVETRRQFVGSTQVIVNKEGSVIALFQKSTSWKGKGTRTLIYRPLQTFENQQPSSEVYKENELKKKTAQNLQEFYLFARQQSSPASKCDSSYALLQVNAVYNDPDFAQFQEPPLYRAAKVTGGKGFCAAVMDGADAGGETLLGKITSHDAEVSNGVDILAVIALGLSVNQTGQSARGVGTSGVV